MRALLAAWKGAVGFGLIGPTTSGKILAVVLDVPVLDLDDGGVQGEEATARARRPTGDLAQGNGPLAASLKARCMDWIIFACVSIGTAAAGFGIVMVAARIEHRRRARHTERFGDH